MRMQRLRQREEPQNGDDEQVVVVVEIFVSSPFGTLPMWTNYYMRKRKTARDPAVLIRFDSRAL